MPDTIIILCPKCNQQLKIPKDIGGMLMKCPTCGQKLYSDFKLHPKSSTSDSTDPKEAKQNQSNKSPSTFSIKV